MVHDERETGWGGFAMILINIKQCFHSKAFYETISCDLENGQTGHITFLR